MKIRVDFTGVPHDRYGATLKNWPDGNWKDLAQAGDWVTKEGARRYRHHGENAGEVLLDELDAYCPWFKEWLEDKRKREVVEFGAVDTADVDLPEACLDGWLGDICRTRMADLPRAYAYLALLATASVLVDPETKSRCNLYVDLDGAVGTGKSTAFEMAFHLLSLRSPTLVKLKAGSAEGLASYLGDVGGVPRLLFPDELAHLLEKSMIERSSFPRILTTAFYDDAQDLTVMKRKILHFNARLSVAGGTVDDQFGDLFGSATTGGLHDRFLFGKCPSGYQHLWRDFHQESPAVFKKGCPVPVTWHRSVLDERDRWVKELGINSRVAELSLRVATICAGFDGRSLLTSSMLGPALALAQYQTRVRAVLQPNPGENPDARMAHMIRAALTKHGVGGWMAKRMLSRSINAGRLGPGVFERALRNLEFGGDLECGKVGKAKIVRLVPEPTVITGILTDDDSWGVKQ